jgi:hypothetical protein
MEALRNSLKKKGARRVRLRASPPNSKDVRERQAQTIWQGIIASSSKE